MQSHRLESHQLQFIAEIKTQIQKPSGDKMGVCFPKEKLINC